MRRAFASTVGGAIALLPASAGMAATIPGSDAFPIARDPLAVAESAVDPLHEEARVEQARSALARASERAREKRAGERRREGRAERSREAARPVAVSPALHSIASCESGGNPRAIGGGGAFRGKYQFTTETWAAVGGSGDPAAASEAEQDRRAAILYAQAGSSPWPVCGR